MIANAFLPRERLRERGRPGGGPYAFGNAGPRRRIEGYNASVLVCIIAAATALRLWQLDSIPLGLHNDEAWTGLNAREVLRDGWIGPYLYPSGLGQPSGPVYLTALLFTLVPQTTFTLRLSMGLFGIAAVALAYAAGRAMFDRPTGLFAAALLAIMPWHLHLSRTAFMVGAWPFIEMAILWALFRARARPSISKFVAVGVLIGLGVYTYNAYPLFLPVAAVPFLHDLASARDGAARLRWSARTAAVAVTALCAAVPMLHYAAGHEQFLWHHQQVSLLSRDEWKQAGWLGRADILAGRGAEWARGMLLGGRPDDGDGLGQRGHPLLDPLTAGAALAGTVMAVRRWRRPQYGVLLAALLVLPFGALLTTGDGLYRRTFGLAPFVALLAALPLAWLWRRAMAWRGMWRAALAAGMVLAIIVAGVRNARAYFRPLQQAGGIRYVYPYQLDAAARAIARLPTGTVAYLYSDRWGAGFETIRWLAPEAMVVDRSLEFRRSIEPDVALDLSASPLHPSAFVLMGNYLDVVDQLRARYPGATVSEEELDGEILYRIVRVGRDS
jgi:4-amino-4-deoxy-L-arabinose transferase-like glycosyltransferase